MPNPHTTDFLKWKGSLVMNKLTTLYIVRHGQTEWNKKGIIQGHSDSPLTKEGKEKAKLLAGNLNDIKFDYIFS